jgi:Dolichyl-phosphate-mannose-protein mannosyltransferase
LVVLGIAIIGGSLALQGWKSRVPTFDLVLDIDNARALATNQRIPDRGVLNSFASYSPPGVAWLMLPGVFLSNDPRLFEYPVSIALYIGTLIGLFLLARMCFGTPCAILAVALYGLSELGLLAAQSIWHKYPLQFFYVWMVYWIANWVERGNTKYLATAVVIWACGMYVFLDIAPALFIIPVVWLFYRPPIRVRPLLVAGILIAIIWYPYLRFEAGRAFVDVKSQVLQQRILPEDYAKFWCNPSLFPERWKTASASTTTKPVEASHTLNSSWWNTAGYALLGRAHIIFNGLLIGNFSHTSTIPGASLVLLLMTMVSLLVLSLQAFVLPGRKIGDYQVRWANVLKWLGLSALIGAALINEFTIARFSLDGILEPSSVSGVRRSQLLFVIAGITLLALRNRIAMILARIPMTAQGVILEARPRAKTKVIVISLLVPWLIFLSMTEADRLDRLWLLWPMQIVVLAALVTYWPLQLKLRYAVVGCGSLILLLMITGNNLVLSRLAAWARDGWSGRNAKEIDVVDYIAHQVASTGQQTTIGYDLYIYRFMPVFNAVDRRYKVGAIFDLLFKHRHGVVNTNQCAEGISPADQYRIVQTVSTATAEAARQQLNIPNDDRFYVLEQFGPYQVLRSH